jgi:hypothetical protein
VKHDDYNDDEEKDRKLTLEYERKSDLNLNKHHKSKKNIAVTLCECLDEIVCDHCLKQTTDDNAYFEPGEMYIVQKSPVYFFLNEFFTDDAVHSGLKDFYVQSGEVVIFIKEDTMFQKITKEYYSEIYGDDPMGSYSPPNKIGAFLYKGKLIYAIDWNSIVFPLRTQLKKYNPAP